MRAINAAGQSSWTDTAGATTLEPPPFVDDVALADIAVAGVVTNSYVQTRAAGNGAEAIAERESGGKKQSRYSFLEHKWRFDVRGGSAVTVFARAYVSASEDGDEISFAYSSDDGTYTEMFAVMKTSDDGSYQAYVLPPSTSGTLYLRVIDSDRTPGNRSLDSITVDHLFVRSEVGTASGTAPAAPSGLVAAPVSSSRIDLTWLDNALDETGFEIERSLDGATWELIATAPADAGGYGDMGLAPLTHYYYQVRAYNQAGGSAYDPADAETLDGSAITLNAFGYKVKGKQTVDLTWSGAASSNVDVRRDGGLLATTSNDGAYTDALGVNGGGVAYLYELCGAGSTTNCSDPKSVIF